MGLGLFFFKARSQNFLKRYSPSYPKRKDKPISQPTTPMPTEQRPPQHRAHPQQCTRPDHTHPCPRAQSTTAQARGEDSARCLERFTATASAPDQLRAPYQDGIGLKYAGKGTISKCLPQRQRSLPEASSGRLHQKENEVACSYDFETTTIAGRTTRPFKVKPFCIVLLTWPFGTLGSGNIEMA